MTRQHDAIKLGQRRLRMIKIVAVVTVTLLVGRLAWVQLVWGPALAAVAEQQRARTYKDPARRGTITDRDGKRFAYTMQARSLTISPKRLRQEIEERHASNPDDYAPLDDTLKDIAKGIPEMIKQAGESSDKAAEKVSEKEILEKLKADTQYEVLVRNVDPDVAADIAAKFKGIAADQSFFQ